MLERSSSWCSALWLLEWRGWSLTNAFSAVEMRYLLFTDFIPHSKSTLYIPHQHLRSVIYVCERKGITNHSLNYKGANSQSLSPNRPSVASARNGNHPRQYQSNHERFRLGDSVSCHLKMYGLSPTPALSFRCHTTGELRYGTIRSPE